MLREVMNDAKNVDIPIDETIDEKVYVDTGVTDRAGFCNWCFTKYEIHITDKIVNSEEKYIKDVFKKNSIKQIMIKYYFQ